MRLSIDEFDLSVLAPQEERPPGPHVSHVIRDIDNRLIHVGQRPLDGHLLPEERRRMGNYTGAGFIWEVIVEKAAYKAMMAEARGDPELWPDRPHIIRQEFIKKDGIWLKPDALEIPTWTLEEYKWTWRSIRRLDAIDSDFFTWLMQIQAYCRATETTACNLFAFFCNGDYRESGPQARHIHLDFSEQELEENWAMLVNHYRKNMR